MASTINGTSTGSGGLISTGDDSGILNIQTNETTAISINASQGVEFNAGTAALPAITTTGDTNTGIFFPAADTIAFAEGGAEAVRIDSSGNFLVGTTTAQTGAKLAVTGGIQGTITSGTAVASTSGTSIDFTGIPSWVKRVTIVYNGFSTNGTSTPIVQLGSGSPTTSGYLGSASQQSGSGVSVNNFTTGCAFCNTVGAATIQRGIFTCINLSGNTWVISGTGAWSDNTVTTTTSSGVTLSGTLDRVRITTVNGTDTFDAGSINIMYEG